MDPEQPVTEEQSILAPIIVDIKPASPSKTPEVAKRLMERSKASPPDLYDLTEKLQQASVRREEMISPRKAIEHNKKVMGKTVSAQISLAEKREQLESSIKTKLEQAERAKQSAIESVRLNAAKVVAKQEVGAQLAQTALEIRQEELANKLSKSQQDAAAKRFHIIKEVKVKAASVVGRQEEALARKAASEDEEKERLARLEEKLAAAEERRLAQAEEQRAKVKAAAEHLREVQERARNDGTGELAYALHEKLSLAEQKRKAVLDEVAAKAAAAAAGPKQPPSEEEIASARQDRLEAKLTAAEERKGAELQKTLERAASVGERAAARVAELRAAAEADKLRAAEAIKVKLESAAKRAQEAKEARTEGLSKFLATCNLNTPPGSKGSNSPAKKAKESPMTAAVDEPERVHLFKGEEDENAVPSPMKL